MRLYQYVTTIMFAATAAFGCVAEEPEVAQGTFGAGPGAASWMQDSVAGMNVRLYVPPGSAPSTGRGLMVVLHGCAQSATDIGDGGNWGATADSEDWVVAAPSVPGGGVLFGCWDYYGSNHSRSNKYNDDVLGMVQALLQRSDLAIDPARVYLSGLSSGAGQAMVLGCLAPDVFAGVGLNAGPTVGTGSGDIGSVATNLSAAVSLCQNLAGSHSSEFSTQLASIIYGNNDFTVAPGYNQLNADVFATIYGASGPTSFNTSSLPGANNAGRGWRYSDAIGPRVELIENTSLGHNWPSGAGSGSTGAFVNGNSVDYPEQLARFFAANDRRGSGDRAPAVRIDRAVAVGSAIEVDGVVIDDGVISSVLVEVLQGSTVVFSATPTLDTVGAFSLVSSPLADGSYTVRLSATDDASQTNSTETAVQIGGPPPPPPGVTATLTEHINAGRLTWAQFGTYYLQYGTAPFTLYQQGDGSWSDVPPSGSVDAGVSADAGVSTDAGQAADASVGSDAGQPADSGQTPDAGQPADAGFVCQSFTASNYGHVQAGRGQVCDAWYVCTVGSAERLGLYNVFTTSVVAETSPGYFQAGTCP